MCCVRHETSISLDRYVSQDYSCQGLVARLALEPTACAGLLVRNFFFSSNLVEQKVEHFIVLVYKHEGLIFLCYLASWLNVLSLLHVQTVFC